MTIDVFVFKNGQPQDHVSEAIVQSYKVEGPANVSKACNLAMREKRRDPTVSVRVDVSGVSLSNDEIEKAGGLRPGGPAAQNALKRAQSETVIVGTGKQISFLKEAVLPGAREAILSEIDSGRSPGNNSYLREKAAIIDAITAVMEQRPEDAGKIVASLKFNNPCDGSSRAIFVSRGSAEKPASTFENAVVVAANAISEYKEKYLSHLKTTGKGHWSWRDNSVEL